MGAHQSIMKRVPITISIEKLVKLQQKWIEADEVWFLLEKQKKELDWQFEKASEKQTKALEALDDAFKIWKNQGTRLE
jgi:hypothetical protein